MEVSIPRGCRCVVVSGPNTGGKTAAAKALAIACLMAKVGMFVPARTAAVPWVRCGPLPAPPGPSLRGTLAPWCYPPLPPREPAARPRPQVDRILADIGDEQSLSLSLSTFSGRVRRQQALLRASTRRSLVILDEVGAGTSPLEARPARLLLSPSRRRHAVRGSRRPEESGLGRRARKSAA